MTYNDPFTNNRRDSARSQAQPQYANAQQYNAASSGEYGYDGYGRPYLNAQPVRVSERTIQHSVAAAYGEMAVGLVLTAAVSWLSASSGLVLRFLNSVGQFGWYALLIGQVVLAVALGAKALSMSPGLARVLFYVYAATMGFSLSTIFFIYDIGSIGLAFGLTAGFFLCLTMIGLTTKRDMLKAGPILGIALIVLIISQVVMMLFNASGATMIVAAISLIIFAGLTVYDAQKTRALYRQYGTNETMVKRVSILAALNLYLDFVNIFLSLLQLFGNRN